MKPKQPILLPFIAVTLSLLVISGCNSEKKDMEELQLTIKEFDSAWDKLDLLNAFDKYSEDAIYLVPNSKVLSWEDIKQRYINMAARSDSLRNIRSEIKRETIELRIEGDLAYEIVAQTMRSIQPGMDPVTMNGKYLHIWEKQKDGTWKLLIDAFSSSDPIPELRLW